MWKATVNGPGDWSDPVAPCQALAACPRQCTRAGASTEASAVHPQAVFLKAWERVKLGARDNISVVVRVARTGGVVVELP